MDIDLLSKMIKELILEHDRVCLPGLGTFVAETVPASFTDKGYTINPPYRKLSFRPLQENDGLLAGLYASENSVGQDVALAAIDEFVSGMKEVLEKKKNVVFPGLGRLRATKENNFFFVSDEDLDIYPEGFGLEPVSLKSHAETKEELSAALGSLRDIIVRPQENDVASQEAAAETSEKNPLMTGEVQTNIVEGQSLTGEVQTNTMEGQSLTEEVHANITEGRAVTEEVRPVAEEERAASEEGRIAAEGKEPSTAEHAGPAGTDLPAGTGMPAGTGLSVGTDSPVGKDSSAGMPEPVRAGKRRIIRYVLTAVAVLVLLLALYMALARIFPEMMDSLLYNKEDYEILHNISLFQN